MCKWGEQVIISIPTKKNPHGGTRISIDRCMTDLIHALNDGGMFTVASCCGHEKMPGNIILEDGRELFIVSDYKEARRMEKIFIKL